MPPSKDGKVSQRLGRISARTGKPILDATATPPVASKRESGRLRATVFHAAERSAEFFDHLRAHYRETRRTPVEIKAEFKIVLPDMTVFDSGTAQIRNISPSGALLIDVKLPKKCYPAGSFKLEIVMKGGKYEGIGLEATPVRFEPDLNGLGVKFLEIFVAA